MNKPQISIIIPVYNAEKYLRQCLDSVAAQTYANWECLLVDDGSEDASGAVCDEYAAKDARFKVYHKENGGVSAARNTGLDKAEGEWVYFCDADDYVYPDGLETLSRFIADDTDLIMGGHEMVDVRGERLHAVPEIIKEHITNEEALCRMFVYPNFDYEGYLWDKLFRLSVIKGGNLSFDEGISFKEDSLFCVAFLTASLKPVWYTTQIVYRYIVNDDSAMARTRGGLYNPKHWTALDAHIKQIRLAKALYPGLKALRIAEEKMFDSFFFNKRAMQNAGEYDRDLVRSYSREVNALLSRPVKLKCAVKSSIAARLCRKVKNKLMEIL